MHPSEGVSGERQGIIENIRSFADTEKPGDLSALPYQILLSEMMPLVEQSHRPYKIISFALSLSLSAFAYFMPTQRRRMTSQHIFKYK